jgi:hypothetical protein
VSVDRLLGSVSIGLSDTPTEAPYLLKLCESAFRVIKTKFHEQNDLIGRSFEWLIGLTTKLLKFQCKPSVLVFFYEMNAWFASTLFFPGMVSKEGLIYRSPAKRMLSCPPQGTQGTEGTLVRGLTFQYFGSARSPGGRSRFSISWNSCPAWSDCFILSLQTLRSIS